MILSPLGHPLSLFLILPIFFFMTLTGIFFVINAVLSRRENNSLLHKKVSFIIGCLLIGYVGINFIHYALYDYIFAGKFNSFDKQEWIILKENNTWFSNSIRCSNGTWTFDSDEDGAWLFLNHDCSSKFPNYFLIDTVDNTLNSSFGNFYREK